MQFPLAEEKRKEEKGGRRAYHTRPRRRKKADGDVLKREGKRGGEGALNISPYGGVTTDGQKSRKILTEKRGGKGGCSPSLGKEVKNRITCGVTGNADLQRGKGGGSHFPLPTWKNKKKEEGGKSYTIGGKKKRILENGPIVRKRKRRKNERS